MALALPTPVITYLFNNERIMDKLIITDLPDDFYIREWIEILSFMCDKEQTDYIMSLVCAVVLDQVMSMSGDLIECSERNLKQEIDKVLSSETHPDTRAKSEEHYYSYQTTAINSIRDQFMKNESIMGIDHTKNIHLWITGGSLHINLSDKTQEQLDAEHALELSEASRSAISEPSL